MAGDSSTNGTLARAVSGAPAEGRAVDDMFSADEVYQRITATALEEFTRTPRQLFFSGLGAGLTLGAVFLGRIAVAGTLGETEGIAANLLYPLGFVIVVLSKYQLFTENTLTPVTIVATRKASVASLLRLWSLVLVANLLGAVLIALLLSVEGILEPSARLAGEEIAAHAFELPLSTLFLRGVIAGALVASMVWLIHGVREATARVIIIYLIFLMIPTAGLFHVITGFVEVVWGANLGVGGYGQALLFLVAVGLGNTVGGVVLVALLNFGQTRDRQLEVLEDTPTLGMREWLLGLDAHPVASTAVAPELEDASGEAHREKGEDVPAEDIGIEPSQR